MLDLRGMVWSKMLCHCRASVTAVVKQEAAREVTKVVIVVFMMLLLCVVMKVHFCVVFWSVRAE
jgi:hypothetical protein